MTGTVQGPLLTSAFGLGQSHGVTSSFGFPSPGSLHVTAAATVLPKVTAAVNVLPHWQCHNHRLASASCRGVVMQPANHYCGARLARCTV